MNIHEFQHLIQDIQKNMPCRGCKQYFKENDINLIGTICDQALVQAECRQCKGYTFITGILRNHSDRHTKIQAQRTQRKLKKTVQNGTNLQIMAIDDILDMHNFLKEFNGDFASLFQSQF